MSEAPKEYRTVFISGAAGGLGRALAHEYARAGRTLLLHARDAASLQQLSIECADRGATVHTVIADLRRVEAWSQQLRDIAAQHPVDLAFVNAAATSFDTGSGEDWAQAAALLEVNVMAAIATAATLAQAMRRRGRGRIVLISSLAAYYGLPLAPAYSASKAAIKAYGEGLGGALAGHGVKVTVVLPGFIRTPMSDRDPRIKSFMLEAPAAARRISRGIERGKSRIAFPQPMAAGAWLLGALPSSWSNWIVRRAGY